jgi:hypothetical protein
VDRRALAEGGSAMTALIVWNNGESYDNNETWCIAVEPELLSTALKLIGEIDNYGGTILAIADEARWTHEPHTLDEWLRARAFSLCVMHCEIYGEDKMLELMKLPLELRKKLADELLGDLGKGYHEDWKTVIEKVAAELRGEAAGR